eukprot:scaffold10753_cov87-Skeletonema_marinoi.AAC.1
MKVKVMSVGLDVVRRVQIAATTRMSGKVLIEFLTFINKMNVGLSQDRLTHISAKPAVIPQSLRVSIIACINPCPWRVSVLDDKMLRVHLPWRVSF